MSTSPSEPPVEPALLGLISRYAAQIEDGKIELSRPLIRETPVVDFCIQFFAQFFENELHQEITGVDAEAKLKAAQLRTRLSKQRGARATANVIRSFEELCDSWPDILGFAYGGSAEELLHFHATYVPRLLGRIEKWAEAQGYQGLSEEVGTVARRYEKAVQKL